MERNSRHIEIGYGIPTYNRYDLLQSNLLLYARDFDLAKSEGYIFCIVDNGNQNVAFNYADIFRNVTNKGVGASWNQICDRLFAKGCTHIVILNDDIYLGKRWHELRDLILKKPESLIRASIDWSAFIIPKTVYEKVGKFDECFYPAYYEDNSYEYRMKLKGVNMYKTPELIPYEYRNSSSLEKDPTLIEYSKKNRKLYIEMWGGEPEREKYKTPFNK